MKRSFDYLIVGGGIIGLTVARELHMRNPAAKIVLLEKEKMLGMHASGRSSSVLHSGIYYDSATLKAKLLPELTCDDLIPCNKVGIRPQLINVHEKRLEMDYVIEKTSDSLHVLNAISPAFTSSLAFAEWLVERAREA